MSHKANSTLIDSPLLDRRLLASSYHPPCRSHPYTQPGELITPSTVVTPGRNLRTNPLESSPLHRKLQQQTVSAFYDPTTNPLYAGTNSLGSTSTEFEDVRREDDDHSDDGNIPSRR